MDHTAFSPGVAQPYSGNSDLIDELSQYAFADDPNGHNDAFDNFTWDGQGFIDNSQETPNLVQSQEASHNNSWTQNSLHQPQTRSPLQATAQPTVANYPTQTFHQHQHQQPQPQPQPQLYNSRPPSQAAFDPRALNHPHSHSPSPVQYGGYTFQQDFQYPLNAYSQHHDFQRQQQSTPTGQARQVPPVQGYSPATPDNFVAYRQPQQTPQGFAYYGDFPVQQHREAQNTVDPNLLSASTFQNFRPEQVQPQYQFAPGGGKTLSPAPPVGQQQKQNPAQAPAATLSQIQPQQPQIVAHLAQQPNGNGATLGFPVTSEVALKPAAKLTRKKDPNAPKRPRGRPRKDGQPPKQKSSDVASPSETGSDSAAEEEEMAEERPIILYGPRPPEPEQAAIWDTYQALWSPRNRPASIEKIRNGISVYGELIKWLRNSWKEANEALKKAENSAESTDVLRGEVMGWRRIVQTVMKTTLEWGHPSHYKKVGGHPLTLIYLREFLVDRITASDFDGPLVLSIMKVMAEFTSVDQDMLEKTKMEKALARFLKKSNAEIKGLVKRVLENAATETKRKAEKDTSDRENSPATTTSRQTPTPGNPVILIENSSQAAGTKRPREETAAQPPPKKPTPQPVREASKPLALQQALKRKEAASKSIKPEVSINGRANEVKPKPTIQQQSQVKASVPSVFSSLSAKKQPGTSIRERAEAAAKQKAAAAAAAPKKVSPPPAPSRPNPAPSQSFSFSQMYAGFNKPKEVVEEIVDNRLDETEEERSKRLRKESRRKLRVTWKADEELVQIQYFSHHPDEEIGQTDSMKRDVDDVGGEGRMLKRHADLDDTDEDEETKALGEDLSPYNAPSTVDFQDMDEEPRTGNFIKRGGVKTPDSPSTTAQEQLEQTTLLVVHALPSDIPPTPKEPPPVTAGADYAQPLAFGDPLTTFTREREARFYAATRPASAPNPPNDLSAILGALAPKPMTDLERTFSMFSQLQQPQQQQQPPPQPAQPQVSDLSRLLAVVQQAQQSQQAQQPPQAAPPPQQSIVPPANDLSAWLASFQQQALPQSQNQQGNANPYGGSHDNDPSFANPRKHGRDHQEDIYDPYEERRKKTLKAGNGSISEPEKAKFVPNFKTVSCKFWKEGKCKKGDDCTYIHD